MQRLFYIGELQHFLRLIDAELSRPCTIMLVGEAALALGYSPTHSIPEIELWTASDNVIWTAAERASEKVPRPIRIRQALAGEPRCSFEDRGWPATVGATRHLTVLIPEIHDLLVLRAARGEPMDGLARLHQEHAISQVTLVERFQEMRGQVSGPRSRFRANFLGLVAKLFGEASAAEVGASLRE